MDTIQGKNNNKWIFLIAVMVLYLIVAVTDLVLFKEALLHFTSLIKKIAPIIVFVFVLMFISNIYFNPKKINKFVGKDAGAKGWIASIVGGILSVGPIYLWYPFIKDLREKGMRDCFIATFFYSRAIKLPMLPIMIFYFGLSFTIVLTFYMILFSILNGIFMEKVLEQKKEPT